MGKYGLPNGNPICKTTDLKSSRIGEDVILQWPFAFVSSRIIKSIIADVFKNF